MRRFGVAVAGLTAVLVTVGAWIATPAHGEAVLTIDPIHAEFKKPDTTYSVKIVLQGQGSLTYQWTFTGKKCGTFSDSKKRTWTWSHPHTDEAGACSEIDPSKGEFHSGTITVKVSDGRTTCTAVYEGGSKTGDGRPPRCTNADPAESGAAAPAAEVAPKQEAAGEATDDGGGGGSMAVGLGAAVVGVVVVGGTTYMVLQRRREDAMGAPCDCVALLGALAEDRELLQKYRDRLARIEATRPEWDQLAADAKAAAAKAKAAFDAGSISWQECETAIQNEEAAQELVDDGPGRIERDKARIAEIEARIAAAEQRARECGCELVDAASVEPALAPASSAQDEKADGGIQGDLIDGLMALGAPPAAGTHPRTVEKKPGEEYVEVTTGGDAVEAPPEEEEKEGRWTVETYMAWIWEHWDGKYHPEGEYAFVTGAREDLKNPDYGKNTKRIREWIIAIYEEAYEHARWQCLDNLAAHAYARIKVDEWKGASLEQFEQAFGTHIAAFGSELSGAALVNVAKAAIKGTRVVKPVFIPRSKIPPPTWLDKLSGIRKPPPGPAPKVPPVKAPPVKPHITQKLPAIPGVQAPPPVRVPPPPVGTFGDALKKVLDKAKPLNRAPAIEKAAAAAHRGDNCPYVTIVMAENFAGKGQTVAKVAPPFKHADGIALLETYFKSKFQPAQPQQVHAWLKAQPHGKQGVMFVAWKAPAGQPPPSHVFNVVNQEGHVIFVDAQTGTQFTNWVDVDPRYTKFMPIP